jgi:hypothetical protein
MKKILHALTIGFTFIIAINNPLFAQNSTKFSEPGFQKNLMLPAYSLATLMNPDLTGTYLLSRNEINIRAMRDFLDRFDKVENALWFSIPNGGFEAYFIQDGYGDRVIYDKNGGWLQSLINYGESKLPPDIRREVKSVYFDFDIFLVEEVQTNEGYEYIVYLEDKLKYRLVKVDKEGVMEIIQDLDK